MSNLWDADETGMGKYAPSSWRGRSGFVVVTKSRAVASFASTRVLAHTTLSRAWSVGEGVAMAMVRPLVAWERCARVRGVRVGWVWRGWRMAGQVLPQSQ